MVGKKVKNIFNKLFSIIKLLIFILIIVFMFEYFGYKGLIGMIIIFSALGLYRLYVMRNFFMTQLRIIESIIFGKPLDKDMWEENELKNTRIKINWGKNGKRRTKNK